MYSDVMEEARWQAQICNSCRYCEGYCSVFPAMHSQRMFAEEDITQLANLCHNCQNCFHACQYTEPHEFAINIPRVLAEVRQDSWQETAFPAALGRAFHHSGTLIAMAAVVGMALLFWAARSLPGGDEGFYTVLSHNAMVTIFLPAFLFPLLALTVAVAWWLGVQGFSVGIEVGIAVGRKRP